MSDDHTDTLIRRAIGGDSVAIGRINEAVDTTDQSAVIVMAALLEGDPSRLAAARRAARSSRDRQVVEIAAAHLSGDWDRVDVLARDHLADYPGSLIVAWIASNASVARCDELSP